MNRDAYVADREREAIEMLADGLEVEEVAAEMEVEDGTVTAYRSNVRAKQDKCVRTLLYLYELGFL